jgi:hypothetical protein
LAGTGRARLEPSAAEFGREPLFGFHALRLLHRHVSGHLVDPGRHSVGQSPFDGKIGRMARLARCEFGRLPFGPLLGGLNLGFERFDMGFEGSDELAGKRSFIRIAEALSAAVSPRAVVPTGRWPNPRSLVVSERLLPLAALRPLANRLGRHPQQFGGLPVGKPLARQFAPVGEDVGPPHAMIPRRIKDFKSSRSYHSRESDRISQSSRHNHFNDRNHTGVLLDSTLERAGNSDGNAPNICQFDDVTNGASRRDAIRRREPLGNHRGWKSSVILVRAFDRS